MFNAIISRVYFSFITVFKNPTTMFPVDSSFNPSLDIVRNKVNNILIKKPFLLSL